MLVEEARDLGKDLFGLRCERVEIVLGVRHSLEPLQGGLHSGASQLAVDYYGQAQKQVARAAGENGRREACEVAVDPGYGDLVTGPDFWRSIRLERRCNLSVPARILLNGNFTFCPISDFKGLNRQRQHARQLLRDELHDELWPTA
jgi:hypothetical protein